MYRPTGNRIESGPASDPERSEGVILDESGEVLDGQIKTNPHTSHERRTLSNNQRTLLGLTGAFVAGLLLRGSLDHPRTQNTNPIRLPLPGISVSPTPFEYSITCEKTDIVTPGGESVTKPGTMEYLHPLEGWQNGVFGVSNATVVRIDRTRYDAIVYVQIPGIPGKTTIEQEADKGRTQTVDQFSGTVVGFEIGLGTNIYQLGDPSNAMVFQEGIGFGVDAFLSRAQVGDQVLGIDAILTNEQNDSSLLPSMLERNNKALATLENGNCALTPPVFQPLTVLFKRLDNANPSTSPSIIPSIKTSVSPR